MHALATKNKYMGILLMKISPEYFQLGREGIHRISAAHARDMARFSDSLTHVVCSGLSGAYDQVTIVEADTLEEIHDAATEFRMGEKAKYIEISEVLIGMKAPPRAEALRSQAAAREASERATNAGSIALNPIE